MPRIAAFGEVMMRLAVPGVELLSQTNTLHVSYTGTGVNVMAALKRLGWETWLVTTLPDNSIGDAAAAHLRKLGIRDDHIGRSGSYIGMYILESGFGRRPAKVTYTNRLESSFNTAPDDNYDYDKLAEWIDILHLCGITLAMNDRVRMQMKKFGEAVRGHGGTVIFDCNYRPSLWGENGHRRARPHYEEMLSLADIVLMNDRDAVLTLGLHSDKEHREEQLEELIPIVASRYNITVVAGTHRKIHESSLHSLRGYMYKNGAFVYSKTLTFPVYDRIGAGDAYASGIVHGWLAGYPAGKTVAFAAAASMLAHTIAGDTPLSTETDILNVMADSDQDVQR